MVELVRSTQEICAATQYTLAQNSEELSEQILAVTKREESFFIAAAVII